MDADAVHAVSGRRCSGFCSCCCVGYTVVLVAVLVAGSSIPLSQMVRQDYIPSDVDEAEFEVEINAPEGISVAGMNEVLLQIEKDIRQIGGVRSVLADIGGSTSGGINRG